MPSHNRNTSLCSIQLFSMANPCNHFSQKVDQKGEEKIKTLVFICVLYNYLIEGNKNTERERELILSCSAEKELLCSLLYPSRFNFSVETEIETRFCCLDFIYDHKGT